MILVDTSIWIDYLRRRDGRLTELLEAGDLFGHPFVIGELLLGHLDRASQPYRELMKLPNAKVARHEEVLEFVDRYRLSGRGMGYVDAHILTAAALTPGAVVWSRDKALRRAAEDLALAYIPG